MTNEKKGKYITHEEYEEYQRLLAAFAALRATSFKNTNSQGGKII